MTVTTLIALAALGAAPAQDAGPEGCQSPRTQLELNECAGAKAAKAQTRLDELYRLYLARLRSAPRAKMAEAQRRWEAFRESWCAYVASGVEGGSAHPYVVSECFTELTNQRIQQLERVSACKEGDVACPSPAPPKP